MVRIKSVLALEAYRVHLEFTDGSDGDVDLAPFLWGPVFEPLLRDRSLFEAVRVDPELRTISWPNGADLDPDVLYQAAHGIAAKP